MVLATFLIPVSSSTSLFKAWILVSPSSMPPVTGCQNLPMLDILFRSKYWVSLLIFLNRMAWVCIGNLMPEKVVMNDIREFRVQVMKEGFRSSEKGVREISPRWDLLVHKTQLLRVLA
jgi:hypothetical protein